MWSSHTNSRTPPPEGPGRPVTPIAVATGPPYGAGALLRGPNPGLPPDGGHNGRAMTIHGDHPFVPPPGARDPVRRLRGRLAAPVTVITAGSGRDRVGLTVSSLVVTEGEPPLVHAVVGPLTDLWETVEETERFVVHVLAQDDQVLADVFAGVRPSPGGPFAGLEAVDSAWGPVLADLPDRAFCSLHSAREVGYTGILTAAIDTVEVSELADPLVHFRGRYRHLT